MILQDLNPALNTGAYIPTPLVDIISSYAETPAVSQSSILFMHWHRDGLYYSQTHTEKDTRLHATENEFGWAQSVTSSMEKLASAYAALDTPESKAWREETARIRESFKSLPILFTDNPWPEGFPLIPQWSIAASRMSKMIRSMSSNELKGNASITDYPHLTYADLLTDIEAAYFSRFAPLDAVVDRWCMRQATEFRGKGTGLALAITVDPITNQVKLLEKKKSHNQASQHRRLLKHYPTSYTANNSNQLNPYELSSYDDDWFNLKYTGSKGEKLKFILAKEIVEESREDAAQIKRAHKYLKLFDKNGNLKSRPFYVRGTSSKDSFSELWQHGRLASIDGPTSNAYCEEEYDDEEVD